MKIRAQTAPSPILERRLESLRYSKKQVSTRGALLKQFVRQMKLIVMLLTFALVQAGATGYSQKVNIRERNSPIEAIFQTIERQTGYVFFYNNADLPNSRISINLKGASITEALDRCFRTLPLTYKIVGNTVAIKRKTTSSRTPDTSVDLPVAPLTTPDLSLLDATTSLGTRTSSLPKPVIKRISGIVKDDHGEPLPGVSILVKGTQQGSLTDSEGAFSLEVPNSHAVLVFSFVGYITQELPVGNRSTLDVTMVVDNKALEEVVVVGYGSVKREELTSAVTSINSEDFISGAFNDPIQMIDGKVAGLTMGTPAAADPNAGSTLQLRGVASVNAGTGPLIVIDGVPGRDLASIPQDEIENITILKDGASSAIYGARGANGVILVTTKKGKSEETRVSYESFLTSNFVANRPQVLSAEEYVRYGRSTLYEPDQANNLPYSNDFYDQLLRKTSLGHYHHLAIESGSKSSNYRLSMNYRDMNGVDIISNRSEYGARLNYNYYIRDKVEVYGNVYANKNRQNITDYMAFRQAIKAQPTEPLFDPEDPTKYYIFSGHDYYNPVGMLRTTINNREFLRLSGDINVKWQVFDNFSTNLLLAENMVEGSYYGYSSSKSALSRDNLYAGRASREQNRNNHRILEWTNNYSLNLANHHFQFLGGYSYQAFSNEGFSAWNANFPSDALQWNHLGGGTWHSTSGGQVAPSSYKSENKLIAFFGRVNYSYSGKYLLTASLRREGSSKFGQNNKWGSFPGVSAAWLISREDFFNTETISSLKLRASYGITGREEISPLLSLSSYGATSFYNLEGNWLRSWGPSSNPNPNLKWEVGINTNFGLDISLFQSKLNLSLDYFNRRTNDLLFSTPVPMPPNLYANTWSNVGSIVNKGIELVVDWHPVKTKNFQYSTQVVGAYGKSKMLKISSGSSSTGSRFMDLYSLPAPGIPGPIVRLEEGQEIGGFFMYEHAGFDNDGNFLVRNEENEIIGASAKQAADRRYVGNGIPDYIFSWNNTFKYKQFDFTLFFKGALRWDVYNLHQMYYGLSNAPGNVLKDAYGKNAHIKAEKEASSYFLEKGDYINLRNISLGYNFPLSSKSFLRRARTTLNATNLFTLTKFSGLDPTQLEVNGLTPGIQTLDFYPSTRSVTLSIQLMF